MAADVAAAELAPHPPAPDASSPILAMSTSTNMIARNRRHRSSIWDSDASPRWCITRPRISRWLAKLLHINGMYAKYTEHTFAATTRQLRVCFGAHVPQNIISLQVYHIIIVVVVRVFIEITCSSNFAQIFTNYTQQVQIPRSS